jgi:hypothetical protein
LNRQDAIAVLRKIMASCASFCTAQAVNITEDKEKQGWVLNVTWTPSPNEDGCLDKILDEYNLESVTANGRIVFRSIQKS